MVATVLCLRKMSEDSTPDVLEVYLKPVATCAAGAATGFALGFFQEFRRPQTRSTELRRASALRAGGALGAKIGCLWTLYMGSTYAMCLVQGVDPKEHDVPSSVVGGAAAGFAMGLPTGVYSASLGVFFGGCMGFVFGAGPIVIAHLEARNSEPVTGLNGMASISQESPLIIAEAARPNPEESAFMMATAMKQLSERMIEVTAKMPTSPGVQAASQQPGQQATETAAATAMSKSSVASEKGDLYPARPAAQLSEGSLPSTPRSPRTEIQK